MKDICLRELLSSCGFEGETVEPALAELYRCNLTRPGKTRIAESKRQEVENALATAFVRACRKPECSRRAEHDARRHVLVSAGCCDVCAGSDNRRAVEEMMEAMQRTGNMKLLVVGGSPGTREDLKRLCHERCELKFVTKETNTHRKAISPLFDWSNIAVVWTSTEISHKATELISGPKVLKVTRRGVAALAQAVRDRCRADG